MMFLVIVAIILSFFSTAIMSYISMATPIGPWIGPTLVLLAMPLFRLYRVDKRADGLAFTTLAGSLGGIIATAFGFSFPTLYFLDQKIFNEWMSQPLYFCTILAIFTLVSGILAFVIVDYYQKRLLDDQKLPFPVGQVMYSMISVQKEAKKAYQLFAGVISTFLLCIFQDGIGFVKGFIPKAISIVSQSRFHGLVIPALKLDIWPMLWAIGFITGHVIAIPLAIGAITQVGLLSPLHTFFFSELSSVEFTLAFCSGMVLIGALLGFIQLPRLIQRAVSSLNVQSMRNSSTLLSRQTAIEIFCALLMSIVFLTYFKFSLISQIFIVLSIILWTSQIIVVAGKIGLATLGRYATFVMIPAMLIFGLNTVQIVIVATFVELVGGIAVDLLFGRKLAQMAGLNARRVKFFQILGITVSALSIGIIFWILISHFGLGSEQLVAYRAQSRQLLISAQRFDYWVLIIGALFGIFLKYIHINAALVLGGLLMPLNLSLGLIVGGLFTKIVKKPESWEPFLSGVFAFNALWMLVKVFI